MIEVKEVEIVKGIMACGVFPVAMFWFRPLSMNKARSCWFFLSLKASKELISKISLLLSSSSPLTFLHLLPFHLHCITPSCYVTQRTPPPTTSSSINSVSPLLDLSLASLFPSLPQFPLAEMGCLPNRGLIP